MRCPEHPGYVLVAPAALAASDGDPFLGMVVGERFAILERLGAGSMGTVYRARQEAMGRHVALKIVRSERLVDPQAKGRFQQEAHATSLLSSPHTVTVFDFGQVRLEDDPFQIDGSLFLAMELLDGESLGDRLKREGRLPPKEAVRIVRQALLSLAEAHEKGVIHRDLKPDNLVLVAGTSGAASPTPPSSLRGPSSSGAFSSSISIDGTEAGESLSGDHEICKVLDFGIAKLVSRDGGIDALETQAGTVFGTPRYMSPEQAQGKALDARSDIYSLGVILYHMLLGKPPYTDGDAVVVMAHHIKTPAKRPSQVEPELLLPVGLEDLLMRVLEKDPARRPQSAVAFIAALDQLGDLEPAQASAELTAVVGDAPAGAASRRVLIGGVATAAAVGLLAAMAVTGGAPSPMASIGLAAAAGGAASRVIIASQTEAASSDRDVVSQPAAAPSPDPATVAPPAHGKPPKRTYQRFDR
jgi:eukaryotic-like serine/threonine-protein kinase